VTVSIDLSGQRALVTGAGQGIGRGIARTLAAAGAEVVVNDLVEERAAAVVAEIEADGGSGATAAFDVTDWGAVAEAVALMGPIDVLVNNAGVQIVKGAVETSWEDGERLLVLDLHTPLRLNKLVLERMIPRKTGTIVDIASMAALAPTPGMFFYNAAKAGLAAASEGLRAEVKPHGIHIVTVYPGPVASDMEAAGRLAYEATAAAKHTPTGSPDVLARLIANAVENKRPRVIYPRVYAMSRHFPNITRWLVDALTPRLRALKP
jgi:short-subunit dehydrogenase